MGSRRLGGASSRTVTGPTGRVTLPAAYVAADVELAYAETSHASQGRTVDRSFLYLLDGSADTRGIYVPLTRGRTTNEAFVVLHDERTAAEVVADAVARTWVDQPATALRMDRPVPSEQRAGSGRGTDARLHPARSREPLPEAELRVLVRWAAAHQAGADKLRGRLAAQDRALGGLVRREEELTASIEFARTRLTIATRTLDEHDRPLRRRSHRFEIASAKNEARSLPGHIEDLESELAELPAAIEAERSARDRTVERGGHPLRRGNPERVEDALVEDARVRGERAVERADPLLIAHLGPVPEEPTARDRWINAAGRIAQHHALWDLPEGTLVGPRPPSGRPGYDITYYAANQAIADLARSPGTGAPDVRRAGVDLSL